MSHLKSDLKNARTPMTSASKFADTVIKLNAELEEKKAELRALTQVAITKDDNMLHEQSIQYCWCFWMYQFTMCM